MSEYVYSDIDAARKRACDWTTEHSALREDILLLLQDIAVLKAHLKHEQDLVRQLHAQMHDG